jgi:hypothetical protein
MKRSRSKKNALSFETIANLLTCQPDTKLDAGGYSEEMVISFIKIMDLCYCPPIAALLRLRESKKKEYVEFEMLKTGPRKKQVIQMLLTPYLEMLVEQWPLNEGTGYIFPFLKLTGEEEYLLEQAGSEGEDFYGQVLQKIERKKIKEFHLNVNKYLAKMAVRQNLHKKITLDAVRKVLKEYGRLALPSTDPLTIMQRIGQCHGLDSSLKESIARLDHYYKVRK